ncbi:MAG TPA: Na+-transporting oxaloacetate decarboxylase subunit gamma [Campylobacterales bacterium]|nr:Na+-transporting oxaloacetate decarboxylase subunit gamma [Campylobacterales bacterium]
MAEVNLVAESFKFMLLGMGVVFLFLLILVQVVKLQAYLINKYFPESTSTPASAAPVAKASDEDEKQRVAAIIAAVTEFRKNKS